MRAFVLDGPRRAVVRDVAPPVAGAGQLVVDVERVGLCGTDVEFFSGEMAYLHEGKAAYPVRLGHEWCGTVASVGEGVDLAWVGRRVTADTMLGCGRCRRCRSGRQHVCEQRYEIGVRGGWAGALAEQVLVPLPAVHRLPDGMDPAAGALVEPGGNALRAVQAACVGAGERVLVCGPGSIGLLAAAFAAAQGAEVHLLGVEESSLAFARSLGHRNAWTAGELPAGRFDAVIDASGAPDVPARALELVEPGRRLVLVGIAGRPSRIDTRLLVFGDVTAVGVLSGSPALADVVAQYAAGAVDPRPLVAATVGLDDVADALAGRRPATAGPGPKVHVDPRR